MTDVIKMDRSKMEEMSQTFRQGAETIEQSISEMRSIESSLVDGALLGQGGSMFAEVIRVNMIPVLQKLKTKFEELDGDVQYALHELMDEADPTTSGYFSG